MVHSKDSIVLGISTTRKQPIGREWSESQHTRLKSLDNSRLDNLLLLRAEHTTLASVRIQRQDSDTRLDNTEVLLQRMT